MIEIAERKHRISTKKYCQHLINRIKTLDDEARDYCVTFLDMIVDSEVPSMDLTSSLLLYASFSYENARKNTKWLMDEADEFYRNSIKKVESLRDKHQSAQEYLLCAIQDYHLDEKRDKAELKREISIRTDKLRKLKEEKEDFISVICRSDDNLSELIKDCNSTSAPAP